MSRKIFAMGGGGFAMEPDNLSLDKYILSLANSALPKVSFIGSASGDSERYIANFYEAYNSLACTPTHLSLFKPHTRDIEGYIMAQDVVHVGGGNTKNLLCLWKDWGLDRILRRAYEQGVVLSGISAGMICWFEAGTTDSFGEGLDPLPCLGFLKGSASPHFNGEPLRRPKFMELIRSGTLPGGLALDDGAGALFVDEKLVECVASRPGPGAYSFASKTAKEEILPVRSLAI